MNDLESQLKIDNHDIAVDERLEIIGYCMEKNIDSVIMQVPDPNELHFFK